ncbi:uncharacterized protein EMH_0025840 [Eimeria mitis]|uniref:Uncharacterized protein n=1 Tax=Eimeria mitis TaxID=44415 RepID=U6KF47_9EIME|nr:uncharacterized protein EMH_0025840 [Eimeria mitis]CDJ35401.1 hypothetical protein EMH_0025840 [Eimeria mitis]
MPPPTFLRPEVPAGPQQRMQQQEPREGNPSETSPAGLMAAAAAAASAAAATASAAAAAAAAAAQRVDSDAVQLYTAQLLGVHKTGVDSLLYLGACFLCGAQGVWIIFGAFGLACLPLAWLQRRAAAAAAAAQRVDSDAVQLYTAQLLGVHKTGVDSLLYLGACFLCGGAKALVGTATKICETKFGCIPLLAVQLEALVSALHLLSLHFGSVGAAAQGVWIIFGAFGLACLPLAWLQRRPSTEQLQQQLQHAISAIREQQRLLQNKYAGGRQMSPSDAETFQQLRAQQRMCSEKKYKLQVLLLMSSLLAHLVLAAGLCLFTAAPQYASFGNQTFVPQNGSDAITCSLHAAAAGTSCRLTVFAAALSRVAFVGVLLCLIYVAACRRAVPSHSGAWDSQQQRTTAGAAARAAAGDLDDLAVVDESARLIGVFTWHEHLSFPMQLQF